MSLENEQDHLEYLDCVLSATSSILRLIAGEKDRNSLLDKVCHALVKTRWFSNAWIILTADGKVAEPFFHAGFDDDFELMSEQLRLGLLPNCALKAMESDSVLRISNPSIQCSNCPYASAYTEKSCFTAKLEHNSRIWGWLNVSGSGMRMSGAEEDTLLADVTSAIALAIHSFETDDDLIRSEELLRVISEASFEAIFLIERGICVGQNLTAEKMFGYSSSEAIGRSGTEWVIPEYRETVLKNMLGGFDKPFEVIALRKDGTTFPCEIQGKQAVLNGHTVRMTALRDITDRKRAEDARRESEERSERISATTMDAIIMMDPEGNTTFWNQTAEDMFGYSSDEVVGKAFHSILAPVRYHEAQKKAHPHFQTTGEGLYIGRTVELVARRKDGIEIPVELSLSSFQLKGKWHAVGTVRDITERKSAEKDRRLLESQLHQAQKIESIGRLAGGVAHDFNNLLTIILGCSELMQYGESLSEGQKGHLLQIYDAGQRAQALTQQLLMFSRKQVIKPKPMDWNQQIERSLKMYRRLIGEDIEVIFNPGDDLQTILADSQQLDQIMANLLVNARDAIHAAAGSNRQSLIRIETSMIEIGEKGYKTEDRYDTHEPGTYVLLTISDTGEGMDEETQIKIFEPFFTTKAEGKGTGLGLSTVFGVVGQNKGSIRVRSELGQGTTFSIYWPVMKTERDVSEQTIEHSLPVEGNEILLLVEDEDGVRELAMTVLIKTGYRVIGAQSAEDALILLAAGNFKPDMLVTDVVLPGINGRQLAEEILKTRPELPVLYTSAYTDDLIAQQGILKDGVELLEKPFSIAELTSKIREMLDGRLTI